MLQPTRTILLELKDKSISVSNSIGILKSRRLALIRELMRTARPYLQSRQEIGRLYQEAIDQLLLSKGQQGAETIVAIGAAARREFRVATVAKNIWGVAYKEISPRPSAIRGLAERGYDFRFTGPALEEGIGRFEKIVDALLDLAAYDHKIRRLSSEVIKTTRRMRVMEERIIPALTRQIKIITDYLGEREREQHYRLKKFKAARRLGQ